MDTSGPPPGEHADTDGDEPEADAPDRVDPFPGSPAAYARNWRQVVLTDAAVGLLFVALGVVAFAAWNQVIGGLVIAVGVLYVFLVIRRYRTWHARRRAVGLD